MNPRNVSLSIAVLLLGIALGWFGRGGDEPAPTPRSTPGSAPAIAPPSDDRDPTEAEPAIVPATAGTSILEGDLSAADRRFLERALHEERERRVRATLQPTDSGKQILERVLEHGGDPAPLLGDFDRFRARVHAGGGSSRVIDDPSEQVAFDSREAPPEVIEFGPGRFEIRRGLTIRGERVEKLEIRGAGIDATTLVLTGHDLVDADELDHLWIHDLTIENAGPAVHTRSDTAVLIENVCFQGWVSAGYSSAIAIGGRTYLGVRGCDFIGMANSGSLAINVRGEALALIEDCLFADLSTAIQGVGEPGTASGALLRNCVLENTKLLSSGSLSRHGGSVGELGFWVDAVGIEGHFGAPDLDPETRLERFGSGYARSVTGLELSPGIVRWDVASLIDALYWLEGAYPEQSVIRVSHYGIVRDGRSLIDVHLSGERISRFLADGSQLETVGDLGISSTRLRPDALATLLPIRQILLSAQTPAETSLRWIEYLDSSPPILHAGSGRSRALLRWNAQTGEPIE